MARSGARNTSEKVWVTYRNRKNEPIFKITSTQIRDKYFLYQKVGNEWKKVEKANSPIEFEGKYSIREAMNGK